MNALKRYWQLLADRVDAVTLRERIMVFAAAAVTLLVLVNMLLLDPMMAKQKIMLQQVKQQQARIMEVQANVQVLAAAQAVDPDAASKARLVQFKQEIKEINSRLESTQQSLVSPEKMATLLEDILRRDRQLQLVSLKTLPTTGLTELAAPAAVTAPVQPAAKPVQNSIYRHGVEITVQGSYADLLHYLEQLEKSSWRMYWGKVNLAVGDYPTSKLTLTLYTLSLDKAWLSI
jgi:MSHA biogenesis protein MshJ